MIPQWLRVCFNAPGVWFIELVNDGLRVLNPEGRRVPTLFVFSGEVARDVRWFMHTGNLRTLEVEV